MRRLTGSMLLGLIAFVLIACGGSYNAPATPPPGAQPAQMSITVTDAPPAGVTVFSFEVSVTGAVLNPGNVDLLGGKGPLRIEVKKLETENAFLSTASIPAGNYTSLNLTFSNPELTFRNDSGATLAGCASGSTCQIKPTGTLSTTVNGLFYLTGGMQSGLLLDLNLANLITPAFGVDFSSASGVTATQQASQTGDNLEELEDVNGIVSSASATQYTLQTTDFGNLIVAVDSNTQFEEFGSCPAANYTCLQNGQSVTADLMLLASGSFVAKKVELQDEVASAADDELDGVISKIDSATQFEMVVTDELRNVTNISVGDPITIQLTTTGGGTSFQVDAQGLSVPTNLKQAFENQIDTSQLLPGQTVQVRKRSVSGGPAPTPASVTTDRVRLRMTRFTATVSGSPSGSNFNIGGLTGVFTANGVNLIQVQTSSQTNFQNVSNAGGLPDGTTVSIRGLLFNSAPNPTLLADKVRKR